MDNLQIFQNPEFGQIRTVAIDGKPYVVGVDVARALGYKNPNDAVTRHCRGCVKHAVTDSLGRSQETGVIPEGDIYRLIVGSELPAAEKFERWIFDKVLPAIRETGFYVGAPESPDDYLVAQAKMLLRQAETMRALKSQVATQGKQITAICESILEFDEDWRRDINLKLNRIAHKRGGGAEYSNIKNISYDLLTNRGRCDLDVRLDNLKKRLAERGETSTKINNVNYLDVIEADARLKEIYTGIVKEMSIKYLAVN